MSHSMKYHGFLSEYEFMSRYDFLKKKQSSKIEESTISSSSSCGTPEHEDYEHPIPPEGCFQPSHLCSPIGSFEIESDYKFDLTILLPEKKVDTDLREYLWTNESEKLLSENDVERYNQLVKIHKSETVRNIIDQLASNVDTMSLKYYGLTNRNYMALLEVLKDNKTVKYLNLTNNQFNSVEVAKIFAELIKENRTIKEINLSYCFIGPEAMAVFSKYLSHNNSIKVLNLSHCNIEDYGCEKFMEGLEQNSEIQTLDLSYNKLTDVCCERLAQSLFLNDYIHDLNLSGNTFYEYGLRQIINGLRDSFYKKLTDLNLSNCGIGPGNEITLKILVSRIPGLKRINLSRNMINGSLIESLSRGLLRNEETLLSLNLGFNPLTSEDIGILLNSFDIMLANDHPFNELNLTDKYIPKECREIIQRLTKYGKRVIFTDYLSNYVLHDPDMKMIFINRINALLVTKRKKRKGVKTSLVDNFFEVLKSERYMTQMKFTTMLKQNRFKMSTEFIKGLGKTFEKYPNIVDVELMRELYFQTYPKSEKKRRRRRHSRSSSSKRDKSSDKKSSNLDKKSLFPPKNSVSIGKKIVSLEKNSLNSVEKLSSPEKNPNKKSLNRDKKSLNSNQKSLNPNKNLLSSDKKSLSSDKKSLGTENQDKIFSSRDEKSLSPETKTLSSNKKSFNSEK